MSKQQNKVAEVKKADDGKLWVRWEGKRKFVLVEDDIIAQFIIWTMVTSETHTTNYPLPV